MECPNCKVELEDYATACSSCGANMASYAKAEAERSVTKREANQHKRTHSPVNLPLIIVMLIVAGLYYYATIPVKKPLPPKDELVEETTYDNDVEGEDESMDFEKPSISGADKGKVAK